MKGVDLEGSDDAFAGKFATGAISKPWQEEVGGVFLVEYVCIMKLMEVGMAEIFVCKMSKSRSS